MAAIVVGIEFLQLWFPNRTVSQNDIVAGVVGAIVGSCLWMLIGPIMASMSDRFFSLPPGDRDWYG